MDVQAHVRLSCVTRFASRLSCRTIREALPARSPTWTRSQTSRLLHNANELTRRGTFRPDRVRAVADRFGVDSQMALENVLYARAWSSEQQCDFLVELALRSAACLVPKSELTGSFVEDRTYKLLIVDSIMNLFRKSGVLVRFGWLTTRSRLFWARRAFGTTAGESNVWSVRRKLTSRNSTNSSPGCRSCPKSSTWQSS